MIEALANTAMSQCFLHYLRRRLVLEQDAVATAVLEHGAEGAEKFIQEVIWRGYFKGWMERRPVVWDQYPKRNDAGSNGSGS